MHSYQHNIKTFNNATRHLTRVERALYRDLIELYYDTEQPLPAVDFDRLARRVMAHSEEEKAALQFVLDEFFERTGDVYTHDYCDEQIENFKASTTAKARAGKASAESRKRKSEERKAKRKAESEQNSTGVQQALSTPSTSVANHKPETINHKPEGRDIPQSPHGDRDPDSPPKEPPVTEKHRAKGVTKAQMRETFPDLTDQTIDDWITARKGKGAKTLTLTAWNAVVSEIRISGLSGEQALQIAAARGWQGVKAEWLLNHISSGAGPPARAPARSPTSRNQSEIQAWLESGSDERH